MLFYKTAPQNKAIIRTGFGGTKIAIGNGILVLPFLHSMEIMDLTVKKIEVETGPRNRLTTRDQRECMMKLHAFLRPDTDQYALEGLAETVGSQQASDIGHLTSLFTPPFLEAMKKTCKQFSLAELMDRPEDLKLELFKEIGGNIHLLVLDDISIEYIQPVQ